MADLLKPVLSPAAGKRTVFFFINFLITSLFIVLNKTALLDLESCVLLLFINVITGTGILMMSKKLIQPVYHAKGYLSFIFLLLLSFIPGFTLYYLFYTIQARQEMNIPLITCYSLITSGIFIAHYLYLRNLLLSRLNSDLEKSLHQSLNKERYQELEILKQQVDPHFIFNAFNVLACLISEDPFKASQYSNKLANVYRYIIFNSNNNLVPLEEEIEFAKDYSFLQEIRYLEEVKIRFHHFGTKENFMVLPVSIQTLIENAIKHNEISKEDPLYIHIDVSENFVVVRNKIKYKQHDLMESSKLGLANLVERCRFFLQQELIIRNNGITFEVFLPVKDLAAVHQPA